MKPEELQIWFEENKHSLEDSYTAYEEPWKQSGFSGPKERWIECRKPIAECIDKSGNFLDIGCANGYLLECVHHWVSEEGIEITPYGLDFSEKLIDLAKHRIPEFSENLYVGNAFYWKPVIKFDFVRTELVYVPVELRLDFVKRLIKEYVSENGKLLLCEYRSSKNDILKTWIDSDLERMGFEIMETKSGFWNNIECTRVSTILKKEK